MYAWDMDRERADNMFLAPSEYYSIFLLKREG